jgi:hypothetical protein
MLLCALLVCVPLNELNIRIRLTAVVVLSYKAVTLATATTDTVRVSHVWRTAITALQLCV